MLMKVLVSDPLAEEGVRRLESGAEVDVITNLSPEELVKKIKEYDALVIRSGTKVTSEVINAADRLKVIGRAGVGIDNVDVEAATKKGIIVLLNGFRIRRIWPMWQAISRTRGCRPM